jgi:hypothetical protein
MATLQMDRTPVSPLTDESTYEERLAYVMSCGRANLEAEMKRLQSLGIIDDKGNLLIEELPADMVPGSDRDFGG